MADCVASGAAQARPAGITSWPARCNDRRPYRPWRPSRSKDACTYRPFLRLCRSSYLPDISARPSSEQARRRRVQRRRQALGRSFASVTMVRSADGPQAKIKRADLSRPSREDRRSDYFLLQVPDLAVVLGSTLRTSTFFCPEVSLLQLVSGFFTTGGLTTTGVVGGLVTGGFTVVAPNSVMPAKRTEHMTRFFMTRKDYPPNSVPPMPKITELIFVSGVIVSVLTTGKAMEGFYI